MLIVLLTILALVLLRFFWLQIYVIYQAIKALFYLTIGSVVLAAIWCFMITGSGEEGMMTAFVYSFLTGIGLFIVLFLIISDALTMVVDFIRYIFRI